MIEAKRFAKLRSRLDAGDDFGPPARHDGVQWFLSGDRHGLHGGSACGVLASTTDNHRQTGGIGDGLTPGWVLTPATDQRYLWRGDTSRDSTSTA